MRTIVKATLAVAAGAALLGFAAPSAMADGLQGWVGPYSTYDSCNQDRGFHGQESECEWYDDGYYFYIY